MKTELGYDVSGPDKAGELEVLLEWEGGYDGDFYFEDVSVYLTRADLVAMLEMFDAEVAEQADEEDDE